MADVLQLTAVITAQDAQFQSTITGAIDVMKQFTTAMQTATTAMMKMAADSTAANEALTSSFEKLQAASKNTAENVNKVTQSSQGLMDKLHSVRGAVSELSTVMLGMGAAGAAALGLSAKSAMDFQRQMELLHTQAGDTQAQVDKLSKSVLSIGGSVGTGPEDLAKSLFHIVSLGVPAAQQMDVLRVAAEGAKTGLADIEETTNALGATMVSGIKGVTSASQAMGVLNAIVGAGNMRMNDLIGALSTGLLAKARTFGLTIQDVGAALATLTDAGMKPEPAAMRLGMSFTLLGAPSKIAAEWLAKIGLTQTALAADMRKPQGLLVALEDLQAHLDKSKLSLVDQEQVVSRAFGGGRSSAAIETLMENLDRLNNKYAQIARTSGDFGNSWAATEKTAAFQMDQFTSSVKVLEVEAGQHLLPQLTHLVDALTRMVDAFNNLSSPQQTAIVDTAEFVTGVLLLGGAIGKVIVFISDMRDAWIAFKGAEVAATAATEAAAAGFGGMGPAASDAGAEIAGLAAAGGPIALLVLAIGGLALAWEGDWGHIREVTHDAVHSIHEDLKTILQDQINTGTIFGNLIKGPFSRSEMGHEVAVAQAQQDRTAPPPGMSILARPGSSLDPALIKQMWQQYDFNQWIGTHPASMQAAGDYAKQLPGMQAWIGTHPAAAASAYWREDGGAASMAAKRAFHPSPYVTGSGDAVKGGSGSIVDNIGIGEATLKQRGVTDTDVVVRFIGDQSKVANAAMDLHAKDAADRFRGLCQSLARTTVETADPAVAKLFEQYGGHAASALQAQSELLKNSAALAKHGIQVGTVGGMGVEKGDLIYTGQRVNKQFGHVMTAISGKEDPVGKQQETEARKELANEHKYLHDINEALKKRHKQLMHDLDAGAKASEALRQQVIDTQSANAQGNPLAEYAAQRHQIMVDMPNGPYASGYYALRQARLGALNRQTKGAMLGDWQSALQARLQATGALDVTMPGGSDAGEAAYLAALPAPAMPITPRMTAANPVGGMEQYIGKSVRGDNALAQHGYAYKQQVQQQIMSTPQYDYILSKLTQQAQDKLFWTGDQEQMPFQMAGIQQQAEKLTQAFKGKSISDLMDWGSQKDKAHQFADMIGTVAQSMEQNFNNAFTGLFEHGAKGFFQNFLQGFTQMLDQMAAKWLTEQTMSGLGSLFGGLFGAFGGATGAAGTAGAWDSGANVDTSSGLATAFGDLVGLASGGPADAGRSYLIGENGPEILTMGGPGTVTPNRSIGGYSQTVHNHFNISTPDAGSFRRSGSQIATEYARTMSRQAARNR